MSPHLGNKHFSSSKKKNLEESNVIGKLAWPEFALEYQKSRALVALLVKSLTPVQETWVRSLSWEDPLEKG